VTRGFPASPVLLAAVLASCATRPQRLSVELSGPAVATPFVVHGNCFAGWFLSLPLRIRGENASTVSLESMNVGVEDARTGRLVGQDDIAFDARFPDGEGEQSLEVPVSLRIGGDQNEPALRGPVVVRGEARGRDAGGTLRVPFRLDTVPSITDAPPPRDGACAAPP
jgi:hypothetical protein